MHSLFTNNRFILSESAGKDLENSGIRPEDLLRKIVIDHMLSGGSSDALDFSADKEFIRELLVWETPSKWIDGVGVDIIVCGLTVRVSCIKDE